MVPFSATISARHQADEKALIIRRATNPRSRRECALAQFVAASTMPSPTGALSGVEPCSFKKAMKSPDKAHWLLATEKEFSSLICKGTWHLDPRVPLMRVIGCAWKSKIKRDSLGAITKYKARLVTRGEM